MVFYRSGHIRRGGAQFIYPKPDQWFRFTILERWGQSYDDGTCYAGYMQLGEFALYDKAGHQVNQGLTLGTSASELENGQYYCNRRPGGSDNWADKLFDGTSAKGGGILVMDTEDRLIPSLFSRCALAKELERRSNTIFWQAMIIIIDILPLGNLR